VKKKGRGSELEKEDNPCRTWDLRKKRLKNLLSHGDLDQRDRGRIKGIGKVPRYKDPTQRRKDERAYALRLSQHGTKD